MARTTLQIISYCRLSVTFFNGSIPLTKQTIQAHKAIRCYKQLFVWDYLAKHVVPIILQLHLITGNTVWTGSLTR